MKVQKYLTKADKAIGKVNPEYANIELNKHLERTWKDEVKQKIIKTLPKRIAENYNTYSFSKPIQKEPISLYIYGEVGTGKTIICAYYYVEFIKYLYFKQGFYAGIKHHFVLMSNLLDSLQKDFQDHENLVKQYSQCDLLVLDEFGAKKMTEYVYDIIYLIINERYVNCLPTIINSNNSLKEIGNKFNDERIIRRIEEDYILIEKKPY